MLIPRQKTPSLSVPTLENGTFDLSSETSERGTVICFYRGLHCPICAKYLGELQRLDEEFAKRGVSTVAVSSDDEERAREMANRLGAGALRLGYNLGLAKAREWGLYISTSRGKTSIGIEEPPLFSEPGLFMVTPQRTLYYASVQRCRSFARIFRNSSARSTSPSRTIIRRAENIPERFEPARAPPAILRPVSVARAPPPG